MEDDREAAHRELREALASRDVRSWRRRLLPLIARPSKRDSPPGTAPDRRPVRRVRVLAIPLGVAAVAVVISAFRPAAGPSAPPTVPATRTEEVLGGSSSTTQPPPPPPPPPTVPERIWPADPLSVTGNEVRSGNARWVVGAPGDLVVIGKWGCDDAATPAVLRPASGTFYVFDRWADDGEEVIARPVGDGLDGAVAVAAEGCGAALITLADGTQRRVETEEGP